MHRVRKKEQLHSLKAFDISTFKQHKSNSKPNSSCTVLTCTAASKPRMPTGLRIKLNYIHEPFWQAKGSGC